jgi:peroxiredoxin
MGEKLTQGSTMPEIWAKDLDGNSVNMIESVAGHWAVVQFYRGHW